MQENLNITIKKMRNKNQKKLSLNVSKTTINHNIQKMKFSYITPRPIHNEQELFIFDKS